VERVRQDIALLEMRSEQLRLHLSSIPSGNAEARRVRAVLSSMRAKLLALKQFARTVGAIDLSKLTLH
jgi:hypothetical protein